MSQADTFLKTKVRTPFARKALVARQRLVSRLVEGLRGPFTLVTAPAGFGKTTLVMAGVAAVALPAAWLSLDKGDNLVDRFLGYLLLALQQVDPGIGQRAAEILSSSQQALPELALTSLVNDLLSFDQDLILVLDDYQSIHNPLIHEALAFLLDHCPANLHLVMATRSDPPIPLARLRARGQVLELRAADLRFTLPEAARFLNEMMGLNLGDEAVRVLEERTEGWIAGLQMASLALGGGPSAREAKDVDRLIAGFSGTNRYILDYLLEEVLASQPAEVQRFLLITSILDQMCAPLCDALLEGQGEDPAGSSSADMLAFLERANLFLVPLDGWFRYHHLFADLLQARLAHLYPGLKPELHRKAAAWLEKEGLAVEAINHALASGAHDKAARLVEQNTSLLLAKGELKALMSWIGVLPEELRRSRPWLCVHQAYALAFAGRLAEVEPLLRQAEAGIQEPGADEERMEGARLAGAVTAVRAMVATMAGRDVEAVSLAKRVRELLPEKEAWDRASAAWALGFAERSLGHLAEARAAFEEMIRLARAMGNIWTLVSGLMDLANVVRAQGQLSQARSLFEEALREAGRQDARSLGYIARMESGLASVLYEQNKLEPARQLIADAIRHVQEWPNQNHLVYAYTIQARLMLAQNDLGGARAAILQADPLRQSEPLARITRGLVELGVVRVWLALQTGRVRLDPGDPIARESSKLLNGWREHLREAGSGTGSGFLDESGAASALMLARVMLWQAAAVSARTEEAVAEAAEAEAAAAEAAGADAADALLARVLQSSRQVGNIPLAIEALVLSALACQGSATKNEQRALALFEEALSLAQPGEFVRVFLDEDLLFEGRPVRSLLRQWLGRAGAHPLREYALYLSRSFDGEVEPAAPMEVQPKPAQPLPEPLSSREIEVLTLIAQGLTNEAISRRLIISTGTVKAHTAAIYRKLDVTNRTEAAARARQLQILP